MGRAFGKRPRRHSVAREALKHRPLHPATLSARSLTAPSSRSETAATTRTMRFSCFLRRWPTHGAAPTSSHSCGSRFAPTAPSTSGTSVSPTPSGTRPGSGNPNPSTESTASPGGCSTHCRLSPSRPILFVERLAPLGRNGLGARASKTVTMRVFTIILLALSLLLQPMLAQAAALAGCSRVPATDTLVAASSRHSCCGMMKPGEACTCAEKSAHGCQCNLSEDKAPVTPTLPSSRVSEVQVVPALPAVFLSWLSLPDVEPRLIPRENDRAPKQSADSIQSLLCVWLT